MDNLTVYATLEVKAVGNGASPEEVLDKAIEMAKLSNGVQVFFNDIIAANQMYSGVIQAEGHVACSTLIVNSKTFFPQIITYVPSTGAAPIARTFLVN